MSKKYVGKSTSGRSRRNSRRKKKNSNIKIVFIFILLFIIALSVAGCSLFSPPRSEGEVTISIEEGTSLNQIAETLKENEIIKSTLSFRIYSSIFSDSSQFKAGNYTINKPMGLGDLTDLLVGGTNALGIKITIPEGFVMTQIATLLEENGLIDRDRFLQLVEEGNFDYEFLNFDKPSGIRYKLEGFIYPETYFISESADEETIIKTFLDEFNNQVWSKLEGANTNGLTPYQILTLSSIIEKEAVVDEERSTIASVFYNRLDDEMRLESCATVQYALGREQFATVVTIEETQLESPFNTYKYSGLPPGPIANPGLKSIEAAIEPDNTDYLFFVAKGDGSHHFSRTYEEHLEAQNQYMN